MFIVQFSKKLDQILKVVEIEISEWKDEEDELSAGAIWYKVMVLEGWDEYKRRMNGVMSLISHRITRESQPAQHTQEIFNYSPGTSGGTYGGSWAPFFSGVG